MAVQCVRCGNWSGNGIICEECERRSREKVLARNQCLNPGGITREDGGFPCCPATGTNDTSPWRPIETAPKDGRFILLAGLSCNHVTQWHISNCRYDKSYERTGKPWRGHENEAFELHCGDSPRFWMPIPELPCNQPGVGIK